MLNEIRLAAGFLTIIPVGGDCDSSTQVSASFGWFPLIGFILGALLGGADYALASLISNPVRSTLLVLFLAAITGAVHLDGLADTADALGAGRDRARALAILHDSRIGTFGAAAVFFVLALKIAALASATHSRQVALYLAPGLARWAMVAVSYNLKYLREQGAGSTLLGHESQRNLLRASLATVIALIPAGAVFSIPVTIVSVTLVCILRSFYDRWLGGITGDLIGAAGEIIETAALIAITARA